MGKLEDNVVSLETAIKLHKAEIEVDSCHYWCITPFHTKVWNDYNMPREAWVIENKIYPAPTYEELLERFPKGYHLLVKTDVVIMAGHWFGGCYLDN